MPKGQYRIKFITKKICIKVNTYRPMLDLLQNVSDSDVCVNYVNRIFVSMSYNLLLWWYMIVQCWYHVSGAYG